MLTPWLELPGVAEQLAAFAEAAGLDLARLGTTAVAEEIKDTAVTQPLHRRPRRDRRRAARAGRDRRAGRRRPQRRRAHRRRGRRRTTAEPTPSRFAARRGAEMAAACARHPDRHVAPCSAATPRTSSRAIEALGLTAGQPQRRRPDRRRRRPRRARQARRRPAGRRPRAPAAGRRRLPHPLHGAGRGRAAPTTPTASTVRDPRPILLSNADGTRVDDRRRPDRAAGRQVTQPVRWDLCLRTCADLGVTAAIELAAGRHADRHRQARAARRRAARDQVAGRPRRRARRSSTAGRSTARASTPPTSASWSRRPRACSPAPTASTEGAEVARGTRLGTIRTNRDEHAIVAPQAGVLVEWLRAGRRHRGRRPAASPALPAERIVIAGDACRSPAAP